MVVVFLQHDVLSADAIAGKEEGKLSVCLTGLSVSWKAKRGQEDGDSSCRGGGCKRQEEVQAVSLLLDILFQTNDVLYLSISLIGPSVCVPNRSGLTARASIQCMQK